MTISDKLDYISNGKINKTSMEYIIEIDQEFHKKNKEIERLNNIIDELEELLLKELVLCPIDQHNTIQKIYKRLKELKKSK